jgi:DNA-binding transcriptional LysR family regulator
MAKKTLDYELLAIFAAVAEEKSFSKAAIRLGIGKGTVSRAIVELEEMVGAELVHRTTHAVALSTTGVAIYERTAKHLRALDDAVGHLPERGEQPSGLLRITAAPTLGTVLLPRAIGQFALRYPDVSFELLITSETLDLVAQGIDVAIRTMHRAKKQSMFVERRLGDVTGGFYAAPSYLARRGHPRTISADHDWILQRTTLQRWKLRADDVRFVCDDFAFLCELASEGVGVTFVPNYLAASYVRSGRLERISIAGRSLTLPIAMVYPSRGQVSRRVIAFRDFLVDWLQKTPLG